MQPELEQLAREAGLAFTVGMFAKGQWPPQLERFALLVEQRAKERLNDALQDALQADLENGVKWLNETAARDFAKKFPALAAAIRSSAPRAT